MQSGENFFQSWYLPASKKICHNSNTVEIVQIPLELLRHTAIWNRFAIAVCPRPLRILTVSAVNAQTYLNYYNCYIFPGRNGILYLTNGFMAYKIKQ